MAAEWFYTTNKQQMGPVSWMDLRELADNGILKAHDMVWTEGMDEWVKAIEQRGLFAANDERGRISATRPSAGRRARRQDNDAVEEDEGDYEGERTSRKKRRKREVEKPTMSPGLKVGLIVGGIACGLLFLGCGGGLVLWLTLRSDPAPKNVPFAMPAPQPKGMPMMPIPPQPKFAPNVPPGPPLRTHKYTVNNLAIDPNIGHRKEFNFQQGQRVTITVINTLADPNTDVDLYVHATNNLDQIIAWDTLVPLQSKDCRVEFVATVTQSYTVRIVNLGPGVAQTCQVTIEER